VALQLPELADGGVVSAASSVASVARGGLRSIYGSNLGNGDNTTVWVNGSVRPGVFRLARPVQRANPLGSHRMGTFSMIVNGMPSNVQSAGVSTYSPDVFRGFRRLRPRLLTPTAAWYRPPARGRE